MYLTKIKVTAKGFKPLFFQGVFVPETNTKLKVESLKKIASDSMLESFVNANTKNLTADEIEGIKIEVIEFKKRRNDFIFTEKLTKKQN